MSAIWPEESNIGMFVCIHTSKLLITVLSHVRTCIILENPMHQGNIVQSYNMPNKHSAGVARHS